MNIQPRKDYVLIERIDTNGVTSEIIILPATTQKITRRYALGRVIAFGAGRHNTYTHAFNSRRVDEGYVEVVGIKKGDTVVYKTWGEDDGESVGGSTKMVSYLEDIVATVSADVIAQAQF